ncbi:uncharacterized protein LOC134257091 [Saccostrea cucullata]|uniref:uncharacterized protein LOC134257091 n=1 Tax=Saccostrea cuccullata TaxID=36930 RepID=UPI002ED1DD55
MCFVRPCVAGVPGRTDTSRFRRGTKAGRRVIRHIHTVCGGRLRYEGHQLGVNGDNLVYIFDDILRNPSSSLKVSDEPCEALPIPTFIQNRVKRIDYPNSRNDSNLSRPKIFDLNTSYGTDAVCKINTRITYGKPRKVGMENRIQTLTKVKLKNIRPSSKLFSLSSLNCRSVKNKSLSICDYILTEDLDLVALTETWLGSSVDEAVVNELKPSCYEIIRQDRNSGRRGGGIALVFKNGIDVTVLNTSSDIFTQFEHLKVTVRIEDMRMNLCIIYRPPPSTVNGLTTSQFFSEWDTYLDQNTIFPQDLVITGDFNFHVDNRSDPEASRLLQSLDDRNLIQHVDEPTHVHGHILDLLITRSSSEILHSRHQVKNPSLSDVKGNLCCDHYAIHATFNCRKPQHHRKEITFRRLKNINIYDMSRDIKNQLQDESARNENTSVDHLVQGYNKCLSHILNTHAPLVSKSILIRANTEWYTDELRTAKQQKRKTERRWRRSKLEIHHQLFKAECKQTGQLLHKAKEEFYSTKIQEFRYDLKNFFRVTNLLMGKNQESPLPTSPSDEDLANKFSTFS